MIHTGKKLYSYSDPNGSESKIYKTKSAASSAMNKEYYRSIHYGWPRKVYMFILRDNATYFDKLSSDNKKLIVEGAGYKINEYVLAPGDMRALHTFSLNHIKINT